MQPGDWVSLGVGLLAAVMAVAAAIIGATIGVRHADRLYRQQAYPYLAFGSELARDACGRGYHIRIHCWLPRAGPVIGDLGMELRVGKERLVSWRTVPWPLSKPEAVSAPGAPSELIGYSFESEKVLEECVTQLVDIQFHDGASHDTPEYMLPSLRWWVFRGCPSDLVLTAKASWVPELEGAGPVVKHFRFHLCPTAGGEGAIREWRMTPRGRLPTRWATT